jgi:hypothetical protein
MGKYTHQCINCGVSFENYFEEARFCCKKCYFEYKDKVRKTKEIECPICHKVFRQKRPEQIFCSVECRTKSTEDKEQCICEYCGKEFSRKKSEVIKNKHHYCSNDCKRKAMCWSEEDTEILKNNFGILTYKEMTDIFSIHRTVDEIKRRAIYIGLTSSRKWSEEEIQILIDNYSTQTMEKVMKLLPNRSRTSILGQARVQNLKSLFYLNNIYSKEEDDYLLQNYLLQDNKELGEYLHRSPSGIAQHLRTLGLHRPTEINSYQDLSQYIRSRLTPWKESVRRESNYTCALTGLRSNIVVHHIRGFNLLMSETVDILDFPIYETMSNYNQQQLDVFLETFLSLQENYGSYICINENVHKNFHSLYGYGNNTEEQWNDFVNTYYK